jgi:uncharacterized membrane-anchored protein YjiN (DUF445 family)
MNVETILGLKDPILLISIVIAVVALVLILILSYYYKKLRDQKIISEIVTEPSHQEKKSSIESKPAKSEISSSSKSEQNYEVVVAQLNELLAQVRSLNSYVKEIYTMIENLQKSPQNDEILENVNKSLFLLEQIQTDIRSLSQLKSTVSFSEINSKLDNLLKLLSTLLQQ